MTKDQIEQWIAANGGAGAVVASSNEKTVPNPARTDVTSDQYDPEAPKTITVEVITWKNPQTGAQLAATRMPGEQYTDITTVPASAMRAQTPGQTAVDDNEAQLQAQRIQNARNGKGYYTNDQVVDNERQARIDQQAADEKARAERERQDAIARQTEQQAEANRLARERLQMEQANQNKPSIVSAPSNQRNIAQMDAAGTVTSVANPNFDQAAYDREAAKADAQAERDRLALMIEAGKLTEATAAAQYKRWFDENVTIPLQRAQEARAQAAELRAAQEAEDRRQQFAATYEQNRQTTAINAGNQAAQTFNQNLQYRVGPKFGEQFSQALNSFQPGAPPANFTQDAFTFKGPSIEAVARKATATALAGISPYAQAIATAGDRAPTVASYDASMQPANVAPSAAPPQGTPPDYQGMVNQYLQNNPYKPGGPNQGGQ